MKILCGTSAKILKKLPENFEKIKKILNKFLKVMSTFYKEISMQLDIDFGVIMRAVQKVK